MELSRDEVLKGLAEVGYVADPQLATAVVLPDSDYVLCPRNLQEPSSAEWTGIEPFGSVCPPHVAERTCHREVSTGWS